MMTKRLISVFLAAAVCLWLAMPALAAEPPRITPEEAYPQVKSGKALLVCAYETDEMCSQILLENAITYSAFLKKLPGLSKDQPIIFYCA